MGVVIYATDRFLARANKKPDPTPDPVAERIKAIREKLKSDNLNLRPKR